MEQKNNQEYSERTKGRSRRKGSSEANAAAPADKNTAKIAAAVICLILGFAAVGTTVYTVMGKKYEQVFFPKTIVNGMDASGRTPEEVKNMIAGEILGYSLVLETRQGTEEKIRGVDINLHPEYDGTLEQLLDAQEPLKWGLSALKEKTYTIETMVQYEEELLGQALDSLDCMNPEIAQAPIDAELSEYIAGVGYEIVPEIQGSLLNREVVLAGISDAVLNLHETLNLEELGAYEVPTVTADDPALLAKQELWNRYVNTVVTYQFGSKQEVLDGSLIHQWISDDGQGGVYLNENEVGDYVQTLARTYNTAYQPKTLKTSYGKDVTITGGPYGWRINQTAEKTALLEILHAGTSQTREPVYSQTANSHDGPDYGDTYVEINLTAQHLYFYKEGKLLAETDFVSGNASKGWATPAGSYPLTYKQRNATLRGETYETPVSYWMPFNGNIGMHDASWRNTFGGTIYKKNGSHGCVNLPPAAAKTIYENISAGMPVLCYHLDGTESTASGTQTKPAQTKPAETTPAETKPAETRPAETTPVETKPVETTPAETKPAQTEPMETKPEVSAPSETPAVNGPGTSAVPQPGTSTVPQPGTSTVPQPGASTVPQPGTSTTPTPGMPEPSGGVVSAPGQ